ncbi:MAG: hypothetical protein JST16_04415 [Bdellovibrionales bacterium]|nr:hypothetical protein [Bdellovibrionales bacterium]
MKRNLLLCALGIVSFSTRAQTPNAPRDCWQESGAYVIDGQFQVVLDVAHLSGQQLADLLARLPRPPLKATHYPIAFLGEHQLYVNLEANEPGLNRTQLVRDANTAIENIKHLSGVSEVTCVPPPKGLPGVTGSN